MSHDQTPASDQPAPRIVSIPDLVRELVDERLRGVFDGLTGDHRRQIARECVEMAEALGRHLELSVEPVDGPAACRTLAEEIRERFGLATQPDDSDRPTQ